MEDGQEIQDGENENGKKEEPDAADNELLEKEAQQKDDDNDKNDVQPDEDVEECEEMVEEGEKLKVVGDGAEASSGKSNSPLKEKIDAAENDGSKEVDGDKSVNKEDEGQVGEDDTAEE